MKGKKFASLFLVMLGTLAFQVYGAAAPPVASARPAPSAAFTVSPASPAVNQTVRFSGFSTGSPTSWSWNFGDGTTSALRSPTHAYSAAGEFTVTLKTSNDGGSSSVSKALTVKVAPPLAGFTFSPSAPTTSQTVGFTDTSTGTPTFWSWTFGDGSTSTSRNPTHVYSAPGMFKVNLMTGNAGGSSSVSKALTVKVAPPVAGFSFSPSRPTTGQTVRFTDASTGKPTSWSWAFGDGTTRAFQNPTHAYSKAGSYTVTLTASNTGGSNTVSHSLIVSSAGTNPPPPPPGGGGGDPNNPPPPPPGGGGAPVMDTDNTISDQAQSATIAFDGLAFVTGSFCAQTFYPPGKVADFFGFQYLRDNDPSNLGHNTEFTTLSADPILAILTDAQVNTFIDLAVQEKPLSDEYGYARFPLAKAFRRLIDGDVPAGHAELSRDAVKAYSAYLFSIDGEMSYLRAQAYASVLASMDASQKAVLDAMKGQGAADWQQPATEPAALKNHGAYSVQLRTYAGEMFAWYVGSVDADVYFCPEREGTYFGSFFMKDIKAMHNPDYTIDSNMTAEMGDAFLAALDSTQKAKITGLVTEQNQDLLNIVAKRAEISKLLRNFLQQGSVDEATVVGLAEEYGELDGEISYYYATRFSEFGKTLSANQKTTLTALRKKATAEDDGSADYDDMCGNGYLYSAPLQSPPTVMNTDFMFGVCASGGSRCSTDWDCCSFSCVDNLCEAPFTFTSTDFVDGGTLPVEYTCDGASGLLSPSPPLEWTGAPQGTVEFAIMMTTLALDGTKWNWVLFHIPGNVTSLAENTDVGTAGVSTDGPELRYYPPCSSGPGAKTYTFTLYALSATPTFAVPENQINGDILTSAISPLIIASREVNVTYTRSGL